MTRLSVLIISLLISFSCKNRNEHPDRNIVEKVINPILKKEFGGTGIADMENEIKFIKGSFTKLDKEECLVILPSINPWGRMNINPILLFEKSENNWKYGNWFNLHSDSLSVVDMNGDHINEILLSFSSLGTARYIVSKTLISIKDNKEKILYSNESIDDSMGKAPKEWNDFDTISINYIILFTDKDNDGIKEISEKKTIGFRDKVIDDSLVKKYIESENMIRLKNNWR